jgi:hypothetical protein
VTYGLYNSLNLVRSQVPTGSMSQNEVKVQMISFSI